MTTSLRLDRRSLLVQSTGVGAAFLLPLQHAWAADAVEPVVDTTSGKIRGAVVDGINAFKGIPYGASTAGTNRFMPPQKPAPWGGVRETVDWAGHAPQAFFGQRRPEVSHLSGTPDKVPVSEDCLTLNLWTPGLDAGKRPVMVWFHGGAFSYGSANTPRTAGVNLARRGEVVVSTFLGFWILWHLTAKTSRTRPMPGCSTLSPRCNGSTTMSRISAAILAM
jgi:hypothetical protein